MAKAKEANEPISKGETVIAVATIWEPKHVVAITGDGTRTIGECIDDILRKCPGTPKLELNLDRSQF